MSDFWHCQNGHLLVKSEAGKGCLKPGCPYRVVTFQGSDPKRAKKKNPKQKGK